MLREWQHRYLIERVGRIGGLWHRAKHVIIYESSPHPTQFFESESPKFKCLPSWRELRKVEEYIELLEAVRRYPQQANAIRASYPIVGAEFLSRSIRVDGRWGGDVRNEGWQIPLWKKSVARPPKQQTCISYASIS
jgi:hypothetical protein